MDCTTQSNNDRHSGLQSNDNIALYNPITDTCLQAIADNSRQLDNSKKRIKIENLLDVPIFAKQCRHSFRFTDKWLL